jgi:Zn-dependent peptidase ImmA (M78 family)
VWRRFTFYHELMHHWIEHDDEMLSLFADAPPTADEALMERLCDVGTAELLLPEEDVQRLVQ